MSSLNQCVHIMLLTVAKGLWTTLFQCLGNSLKATPDKPSEFYSCIKNMCEKAGVLKSQSLNKSDWPLNMCTTQILESLSSGPQKFCTCKNSGKAADYMCKPHIVIEAVKKLSGKGKLLQYSHPYNNYITLQYSTNFCNCLLLIVLLFMVSKAFLIFSLMFCYCTLLGYRGITR